MASCSGCPAQFRCLRPIRAESRSRNSLEIEPRADLEAGTGCTPKLAVAKVNALFAGLNRGDAETVASMFPEAGHGLVIQPELEISQLQERAITPDQVRHTVGRIAGLHFVFTEPLQGWARRVEYVTPGHTGLDGGSWAARLESERWRHILQRPRQDRLQL